MVISSTEFFEAIRMYKWRQILFWIHSKETVSYPEQTEWRLDDDVNQSQPRNNPADIVEYIYFGTTKGGWGGYITFFNKPKSSVKALFYAKSSGVCVTFNTDLQDFYSTYFVLLQHRGAPISIDGEIQIPGCTIPGNVKTVLINIDNYFNYLKRQRIKNQNIFNKFKDYLNPELLAYLNPELLQNGGFRRSRKARKTRKTRKTRKSLHK